MILNTQVQQLHLSTMQTCRNRGFSFEYYVGCCQMNAGKQRDRPLGDNDSVGHLFKQVKMSYVWAQKQKKCDFVITEQCT